MPLRDTSGRPDAEHVSPPNRPIVAADDVHVTYADGTTAVNGVSLRVSEGEFFGFLGPNGAGKTTTIKTLATLLSPSRGTVRIAGHDTAENPRAVRESIGYMAQETSVDVELTARENLRVACRIYGVPEPEREQRIDDLLDLVDLADVADRRAETFSGGMQKRLDAATVLVHRPPVVFLDEPTTGLDPEARLRVWNYFREINDQGTTVFLTTQYLEEADELCDRLALLQDGRVTHTGTPSTLKRAVGTEAVALTLADASPANRRRAASVARGAPALDDTVVETTPDGIRVSGEGVRSAASALFVALDDAGVEVASFDVDAPTLDDVFLALASDRADAERDATEQQTAATEVGR